jgi:GNAT superfamily N-acetyltransferase
MKISYSRRAADTPAFALIAEGWNELVQGGLTPELRGDSPVGTENQVLYAEREDGEIVAFLCFTHHEALSSFSVSLAYVEPTSRKQGVFRDMWAALIERAKRAKVRRVTVDVHPDNENMTEVMSRLSMPVVAWTYEALLEV